MKKILNNKPLLFIILISLIARFFISFGTGLPWISVDSVNYIIQAKALLNGGYEYYFPNGYPLIIALFIFISSLIPLKIGLILFNIFISTLGVFFIYLISEKYFTENKIYPLIAAAVVAFYPNQLNYVHFILTEVPAAFFLILSLYFFIKDKTIFSGLAIGIASIIKISLLPAAVLFSLYLFVSRGMNRHAVYFLIFSLLPLVILSVYGFAVTGEISLTKNSFHNLYLTAGVTDVNNITLSEGLSVYFNYLSASPVNFLTDRVESFWNLWGFLPAATEGLRENIFYRLLIGLRFPLLLFGIYGYMKTGNKELKVFLILPALVLTVIHTLTFSGPRFTFPAEPFLIVLGVKGIEELYNKYFRRQVNT